jgi:predicted GH43/DUF377 family glycosyl hydrolase
MEFGIGLLILLILVAPAFAAYSPPGFALDMWFIKEKGVWHQFELNGPHPSDWDKPWPPLNQPERGGLKYFEQGVFHSTSTDLIAWKDEGVDITIGKPGEWDDGKIASGNIVKHGDTFYLFYPGIRTHGIPGECATPIGVATSRDMVHWTKHPDNPVMVPDGKHYDPAGNWRDCSFLWDAKEKVWYTVVCATAVGEGPIEARGCIALAKSRDLIHWEYLPPLVVSDRYTLGMELPFLFKHGKTWYLGHSMYSGYFSKDWLAKRPEVTARGGVHYMTSDSMFGPYTIPEDDCLGCQVDPPPYAVQLIDQNGDKLFMHWGPQRYATALPKKVDFPSEGRMRLVYWKGTEIARKESLLLPGQRDVSTDTSVEIGKPVTDCFFEGTVKGSKIGFALGDALLIVVDSNARTVYSADPATHAPREARKVSVPGTGPVRIRLVADGSVVDVYANDVWLFAEQCRRPQPDQAHVLALSGRAVVGDIRLDRLATGNTIHDYGFNY